jgi:hypothetical protein
MPQQEELEKKVINLISIRVNFWSQARCALFGGMKIFFSIGFGLVTQKNCKSMDIALFRQILEATDS